MPVYDGNGNLNFLTHVVDGLGLPSSATAHTGAKALGGGHDDLHL